MQRSLEALTTPAPAGHPRSLAVGRASPHASSPNSRTSCHRANTLCQHGVTQQSAGLATPVLSKSFACATRGAALAAANAARSTPCSGTCAVRTRASARRSHTGTHGWERGRAATNRCERSRYRLAVPKQTRTGGDWLENAGQSDLDHRDAVVQKCTPTGLSRRGMLDVRRCCLDAIASSRLIPFALPMPIVS